jgi:hypothetical protein
MAAKPYSRGTIRGRRANGGSPAAPTRPAIASSVACRLDDIGRPRVVRARGPGPLRNREEVAWAGLRNPFAFNKG